MPNPVNPSGFNKFAYVINNPLRYNDPSGHAICSYIGELPDCDNADALLGIEVREKVDRFLGTESRPVNGLFLGVGEVLLAVTGPGDILDIGEAAAEGDALGVVVGAVFVFVPAPNFVKKARRAIGEGAENALDAVKHLYKDNDALFEDGVFKQLTPDDLSAARRESELDEVVTRKSGGDPFDHFKKVKNAHRGLKNRIRSLNTALSSNEIRGVEREHLTRELAWLSTAADLVEEIVPKVNS